MENIILAILTGIIVILGFIFTGAITLAIASERKDKDYYIHPSGVKIRKYKE